MIDRVTIGRATLACGTVAIFCRHCTDPPWRDWCALAGQTMMIRMSHPLN